jgi:hypothetical protein
MSASGNEIAAHGLHRTTMSKSKKIPNANISPRPIVWWIR